MRPTREESNVLYGLIEDKRLEIARVLFSPQNHTHGRSMARKVVALAVELAELTRLREGVEL